MRVFAAVVIQHRNRAAVYDLGHGEEIRPIDPLIGGPV
jgi:hypothetical protein